MTDTTTTLIIVAQNAHVLEHQTYRISNLLLLSLRVRDADGNFYITLKGRSEESGTANTNRSEDEMKWSIDALNRITDQLPIISKIN